jgi:plastocyanin
VSRRQLTWIGATIAAAALLLVGAAAAAPTKVVGKVGPGYTISLSLGGKKVRTLKAGRAYRFVVTDRSEDHDFHLIGPGVNRVITGQDFMGTRAVVVKLRKGTYRFLCAPHSDAMRGSFRAVS